MTVEEEMKIIEEIDRESIKNGRLLYNYEIKEVLDRFIVKHDNAPAVVNEMLTPERPQGEYVDISKLRLMTVEECAGHTIDYAMGWKACIEWIKKGGKE